MDSTFCRIKCRHPLLLSWLAILLWLTLSPYLSGGLASSPSRQLPSTATPTLTALALPAATPPPALIAQSATAYQIVWWNIVNGYGKSESGVYQVAGASGMVVIGNSSGGNRYHVWNGAWTNLPVAPTTTSTPTKAVTPTPTSSATPFPTATLFPTATPTPRITSFSSIFLPIVIR